LTQAILLLGVLDSCSFLPRFPPLLVDIALIGSILEQLRMGVIPCSSPGPISPNYYVSCSSRFFSRGILFSAPTPPCHFFHRTPPSSQYETNALLCCTAGLPKSQNIATLKSDQCPHVVVGTPGRIKDLVCNTKDLKLDKLKFFVVDECDKVLEQKDMRKDVTEIFVNTPHNKQVMMFSATLSQEVRPVCKKFCQNAFEVYVDNETKLTLHGLKQFYVRLDEKEKNRKLNDLLDALEFNQVVIFVSSVQRAKTLNSLLVECNFPSICIHGGMKQEERIKEYQNFKDFNSRILVTTDLFGRGMDIERVNIVFNYDFPNEDKKGNDATEETKARQAADTYLHRVGRAGRFGTKGLAISFISSELDKKHLEEVQMRFEVNVPELPDEIDVNDYM